MRRRVAILGVLALAAGALVLVLVLSGGGAPGPPAGLPGIAGGVVPGASAALMAAPRSPAAGQGLHIVLPDAAIHPPAGSGSPATDSAAASFEAGAGWRAALIAAAASTRFAVLTHFVTTDRTGAQAPGAAFYLDGSVRTAPGQNPAAGMARLDRVSPAALRRQLEDNLTVLRRGLPAGSIVRAVVTQIPVGPGSALAVELRVRSLQSLVAHFGDLLGGLATGLAPGLASTVEGLAIHVVDAQGRNAGSWMAVRAQQGTTVIDPRLRPPAVMVPRMRFADETGGPAAVPSAHAGPVAGGGGR